MLFQNRFNSVQRERKGRVQKRPLRSTLEEITETREAFGWYSWSLPSQAGKTYHNLPRL